ncbi:hypothetical protein OCJ37_04015 [Xanthomonas sp. AM6]|uniref:hypothetical protein n=1 Tax=Xanthomonas sp. AM6 TaxID=2982531 RepID=UPI0021D85E64|nr:hypothetical protein [Xanthomonas sp. AM6]UYB53129.1 hypothetical protein OCJ37_04015 [Xanthomonas sp. AM6]
MKAEFRDYLESRGPWLMCAFFLFPVFISKTITLMGFDDLCLGENWKAFTEAAWGGADAYCSAMALYLLLSPLVFLWMYSKARLQEVYDAKAVLIASGNFGIFLFLLFLALVGPSASSIEDPAKGLKLILILGRSHAIFCMMYGCLVMACVATGYVSVSIFWKSLIK